MIKQIYEDNNLWLLTMVEYNFNILISEIKILKFQIGQLMEYFKNTVWKVWEKLKNIKKKKSVFQSYEY